MKITHFVHTGVREDGSLPTGGAVEVKGRVIESARRGGCGRKGCDCSPGQWISIVHPRTEDGVVVGYTAYFDSRKELEGADMEKIEQAVRKLLN